MLGLPPSVKIFLCLLPIDMRKSFDSLAELAQSLCQQNPLSGHLFVFSSKNNDRIKLLYWDTSGYVIIYKRLEQGRFNLPRLISSETKSIEIDINDLSALLSGFNLLKVKREHRYEHLVRS
jgi:transposase